MEEYIIYVSLYDSSSNRLVAYAVEGDYYVGFITLDNIHGRKAKIFPTENSAIIWWKRHLAHFQNPLEDYINIEEFPTSIVNVGRLTNHNLKNPVAIHRLTLLDSPANEPDPKTMTREETVEYSEVLRENQALKEAVGRITGKKL